MAAAFLADADRLADERDAEVAHYGFIYTLPAAQNSSWCLRRIRFAGCHDFWVGNRRQAAYLPDIRSEAAPGPAQVYLAAVQAARFLVDSQARGREA